MKNRIEVGPGTELRCTRPERYTELNCAGHSDTTAREGFYLTVPTGGTVMTTLASWMRTDETIDVEVKNGHYFGRFIRRNNTVIRLPCDPIKTTGSAKPEMPKRPLIVVIKDSVLDEIIECNDDELQARFLEKCEEVFSNFDEYTSDDIDATLDNGYEKGGNGNSVCIHHP